MQNQIKTGLRRSGLVLALLTSLIFTACDGSGKTKIRRGANAAFNETQTKVILAETSYDTSNPDEPYYNATSGSNFEVTLHEIDAAALKALGESPSQSAYLNLLNSGRQVLRFQDEGQNGDIQYSNLYYFRGDSRILGKMYDDVLLIDASNGVKQSLKAPQARLDELVNTPQLPELSQGLSVRQFAPSPDGETVAVWQTTAYQLDDPWLLYFKHVVSFFDADSGAHQGSYLVQIDDAQDSTVHPNLAVAAAEVNYATFFLWNKTSNGVFVVTKERSISLSTEGVTTTATEVPAKAVATAGGRIADNGLVLYPYLEDSNETRMIIKNLTEAWTPFMDLETVPAGTEDYSH